MPIARCWKRSVVRLLTKSKSTHPVHASRPWPSTAIAQRSIPSNHHSPTATTAPHRAHSNHRWQPNPTAQRSTPSSHRSPDSTTAPSPTPPRLRYEHPPIEKRRALSNPPTQAKPIVASTLHEAASLKLMTTVLHSALQDLPLQDSPTARLRSLEGRPWQMQPTVASSVHLSFHS